MYDGVSGEIEINGLYLGFSFSSLFPPLFSSSSFSSSLGSFLSLSFFFFLSREIFSRIFSHFLSKRRRGVITIAVRFFKRVGGGR